MLKANLAPLSNPLRPVWDALNKHSKREESGEMNNDGYVELDCMLKVRHHPRRGLRVLYQGEHAESKPHTR